MKKIFYCLGVCLLFATSCSDTIEESGVGSEVKAISAAIGTDVEIGVETRALTAVLTDPTSTAIATRGGLGWKLDVQIYNSTTPYINGKNTYIYGTGSNWIPQASQTTYFPNYTSQYCEFWMYPVTPTTAVAYDQSSADVMLANDILYVKSVLAPAHILSATLKHAQSMLDFTFNNVPSNIQSVVVRFNGQDYIPYQVPSTSNYMVILPSGVSAPLPVITIKTTQGSTYSQTVKVGANPSALGVNYRYVFTLTGFSLVLSPITIVDWVSGGMLGGNYVADTAYPTFRGPAGVTCVLTFDNGLTQSMTFNSQGECTVKPLGRTITMIDGVLYPVILGQMIIDLNSFFIT